MKRMGEWSYSSTVSEPRPVRSSELAIATQEKIRLSLKPLGSLGVFQILSGHCSAEIFRFHTSTILTAKIQQDATVYQNFIIPYFNEAQHVSGVTPPIIRSLKLYRQPLVLQCPLSYAT